MRSNRFALALSVLVVPTMLHAQVKQSTCITQNEVRSGIAFLMPMAINAVRTNCMPHLAKDSFLAARSQSMIAGYKSFSEQHKGAALGLISKFAKDMEIDTGDAESNAAILDLVLPLALEDALREEMDKKSCEVVDTIFANLEPLPAENMTNVLQSIVVTAIEQEARKKAGSKRRKNALDGASLCPK